MAALHGELSAWFEQYGEQGPYDEVVHSRSTLPSSQPSLYPSKGDSLAAHELPRERDAAVAPDPTLPSRPALLVPRRTMLPRPLVKEPGAREITWPMPFGKTAPGRVAEATGPYSSAHMRLLQEERVWAILKPALETPELPLRSAKPSSSRLATFPSTARSYVHGPPPGASDPPAFAPPSYPPRISSWKLHTKAISPALQAFLVTLGLGLTFSFLTLHFLPHLRHRPLAILPSPAAETVVRASAVAPANAPALAASEATSSSAVLPLAASSAAPALPPDSSLDERDNRFAAVLPAQVASCIVGAFPDHTFAPRQPFDEFCAQADAVEAKRWLHKTLVVPHRNRGVSPAMLEWSRYGWYELAVVASLRGACCPAESPPLQFSASAAEKTSECATAIDAPDTIRRAVLDRQDTSAQTAIGQFLQTTSCASVKLSLPDQATRRHSASSEAATFEKFFGRLRKQQNRLAAELHRCKTTRQSKVRIVLNRIGSKREPRKPIP